MKHAKDKGEGRTGALVKNRRADRLKLALRENLKRRKSQARGRSDVKVSPDGDDVSPRDVGGKKPGK